MPKPKRKLKLSNAERLRRRKQAIKNFGVRKTRRPTRRRKGLNTKRRSSTTMPRKRTYKRRARRAVRRVKKSKAAGFIGNHQVVALGYGVIRTNVRQALQQVPLPISPSLKELGALYLAKKFVIKGTTLNPAIHANLVELGASIRAGGLGGIFGGGSGSIGTPSGVVV